MPGRIADWTVFYTTRAVKATAAPARLQYMKPLAPMNSRRIEVVGI